uniref:Uncharacterized protein n=1 Tax=Pyxicephalus adspersus TaxID=30357 RepID=A0AAV3B531_PYXAD|nr:TPA: hypothetical protein GDO54_000368 [Pyxicephalus adspersus]
MIWYAMVCYVAGGGRFPKNEQKTYSGVVEMNNAIDCFPISVTFFPVNFKGSVLPYEKQDGKGQKQSSLKNLKKSSLKNYIRTKQVTTNGIFKASQN